MNYQKLMNQGVIGVPPSGIRKFFDIVSTMPDAISLGVGEPDFVTPWSIREKVLHSIEEGETHYTSNWGTIELRGAIARYLKERCDLIYDEKSEIMVTVGASEGIDLALRALLSPGDEVLIPDPAYVSYMPGVVFAGGTPILLQTKAEDCFRLRAETLRAAITPRTKALILPYPNNPTGAIMEKDDLLALAGVLEGTDIIVISDEIYSELNYSGVPHVSFASLPGMWERTITLNGFSKAFAMTGWRIGYACGPKEIIAMMCKIHQFAIMCAPTQGQVAALAALEDGFENDFLEVKTMTKQYNQRRRLMVNGFRRMGLDCFEPLGAFYVFPSIQKTGLTSQEFCERLLYEQKVATVPGTAFGPSGEGHIRCSYAASVEKLLEALRRIEMFVQAFL